MFSRSLFLASALVAGALFAAPASAAEMIDYSAKSFEAAKSAGRPILVEIHASWCSTCKAQTQVLGALESAPQFKDLLVVRVDFDSQKDVVRQFGARAQSTLITFKDGKETGRSVGDTDRDSLADLLNKAI
jgi:thioredoxin 1